jgi:hypothetical protein
MKRLTGIIALLLMLIAPAAWATYGMPQKSAWMLYNRIGGICLNCPGSFSLLPQSLSLIIQTPIFSDHSGTFSPSAYTITLSTQTPLFQGGATGSGSFNPTSQSITLTTTTPAFAGYASGSFTPSGQSITLTTTTPSFNGGGGDSFVPTGQNITLTYTVPTFTGLAAGTFNPSAQTITLVTSTPTFTGLAAGSFTPSSQTITLVTNTPSFAQSDPYTSLLLHFDGTANCNTTTCMRDSSSYNHTYNTVFPAITNTTQYKFGTASMSYPSGAYYNSGLSFANATEFDIVSNAPDFTIDFQVYLTTCTTTGSPLYSLGGEPNEAHMVLQYDGGGKNDCKPKMYVASKGQNTWDIASDVGTLSTAINGWHHVALTRYGTTFTLWVDGASSGTATSAAIINAPPTTLHTIGYSPVTGVGSLKGGYIDEFRFSKGIARWTGAFNAPGYAYPQ